MRYGDKRYAVCSDPQHIVVAVEHFAGMVVEIREVKETWRDTLYVCVCGAPGRYYMLEVLTEYDA